MAKVDYVRAVGVFESRDEAAKALRATGDMAFVRRGVARLLLLRCPCGCGDDLVVNLDSRVGPAWRFYRRGEMVTLFPSYWRDSACGAHFILWSNRIHWCTWDRDDEFHAETSTLERKVREMLTTEFASYYDLSDALDEIPWEVLQACHALVDAGLAEANVGRRRGEFRLRRG